MHYMNDKTLPDVVKEALEHLDAMEAANMAVYEQATANFFRENQLRSLVTQDMPWVFELAEVALYSGAERYPPLPGDLTLRSKLAKLVGIREQLTKLAGAK